VPRPDRPLDLDQDQPPVRPGGDEVRDLAEPERHARLLSALRALLELPPTTQDREAEA
jgi:hypothetical protein